MPSCNLATKWKLALEDIERQKRIAARKADEVAHDKQKLELADKGWVFTEDPQWHPHNGDEWVDTCFQSPRMEKPAVYHSPCDLLRREAEVLAHQTMRSIEHSVKEELTKELIEYHLFTESPTEIELTLKYDLTENSIHALVAKTES